MAPPASSAPAGRGGTATTARTSSLLLAQTGDVPTEHLGAQFVCAAALVLPGGDEHVERGVLRGVLDRNPRGTNGFGYDPVFAPEASNGRTLAEYDAAEKNAISHRGRAMRAIAPRLLPLLTP
ncbi:hypothetical protein GCM10025868_11320 [Angustibacter aerolatus]|uniref:Non-canonical purine NTP pyrophosphatase n=1 Tax=Angustibacter aerolatus TaxID=1162965 RepID=A0ABQ6JDL9_9ACTN|nr:hypothetical protein GCM10025868_11320 [Angustibacter aerolatus]